MHQVRYWLDTKSSSMTKNTFAKSDNLPSAANANVGTNAYPSALPPIAPWLHLDGWRDFVTAA